MLPSSVPRETPLQPVYWQRHSVNLAKVWWSCGRLRHQRMWPTSCPSHRMLSTCRKDRKTFWPYLSRSVEDSKTIYRQMWTARSLVKRFVYRLTGCISVMSVGYNRLLKVFHIRMLCELSNTLNTSALVHSFIQKFIQHHSKLFQLQPRQKNDFSGCRTYPYMTLGTSAVPLEGYSQP